MGREYFKAFHSYLKSIEPLNDSERGRLFTAMLEYSSTGVSPRLSGNERFIFPTMKANLDREIESYRNVEKRNRENGRNGGRPKNPKNPLGFFGTQETQTEQDKDKDKDYISPPIYPPQGGPHEQCGEQEEPPSPVPSEEKPTEYSADFTAFWKSYPSWRATDKAGCYRKFKKIPKETLPRLMESLEAHKRSKQWRDGIIPLASTWLNQRRWECSPPPPPKSTGRHAATVGYEQRPVDEAALQSLIINLNGGAE